MGDCVTGTGATRGRASPEGANVAYAPEYESTLFGYSAGRANEAKYVNAGVAAGSPLATGYLQSKRISSAGLLTSSGSAYAGD